MNVIYLIIGITSGLFYSYIVSPVAKKYYPTISPTSVPNLHNGIGKNPI